MMTHKKKDIEVVTVSEDQSGRSFFGLGIAPKILDILERINFKVPTPIQLKAIPIAIEGKDVVGIAQTGTGKTHAFAIPMVQQLAQKAGEGLVLAPTRELAVQIEEAIRGLAGAFGMRTACLIGGAPMNKQIQALRAKPRIVIATPGRLLDHIKRRNYSPVNVNMLVLDEADRMFDMGFAPQIAQVLHFLNKNRQTMLFSATIAKEVMDIASKHMKLPVSIEIAPSGTTADNITQELFIVKKDTKPQLLNKLLAQYQGSVLLFSRTKHNARKIMMSIRQMGYTAAEIHSNRSQSQRQTALEGFKSGKYRVLVATDIASRGIDVRNIELVINYDLPEDAENYVHRIGRTARAGSRGHAISFATPDQRSEVKNIERIIKSALPLAKHPELPSQEFFKSGSDTPKRKFNRRDKKRHGSFRGSKSFSFSRRPRF